MSTKRARRRKPTVRHRGLQLLHLIEIHLIREPLVDLHRQARSVGADDTE